MNWTGQGIVFPRDDWAAIKSRTEFDRPGVYVLVGYSDEEDDLTSIYIGEGDGIQERIDSHDKKKGFWDWCIAFVAKDDDLTKTHVQWLEYALVERAKALGRCKVENTQTPKPPAISASTKADVDSFLRELLQILPLVGLRSFEQPKIVSPKSNPTSQPVVENYDTIVIPANEEGFDRVFLGQNSWHAVRIGSGAMKNLKYIAAYQTAPVSAITYVAEISAIEPYGDVGKSKIVFAGPAKKIEPVVYDGKNGTQIQSIRYTRMERILKAKTLSELLPWGT